MRFSLELTNPRAGWIDVAIAIGDDSFGFAASDVLNDPAGYELAVTRDDACTLAWTYAHDAMPRLVRPQLVHACAIDAPRAIASEILRCLRVLHPLLDGGGWPHPFPIEAATRLAGLLD